MQVAERVTGEGGRGREIILPPCPAHVTFGKHPAGHCEIRITGMHGSLWANPEEFLLAFRMQEWDDKISTILQD